MSNKYIVRQPIKDAQGKIWGHEILYHGENQAFTGDVASQNEYAAADTIYSFLTQNSTKALRGSLNFMTFTTILLMKRRPACLTARSWSSRSTTASSSTHFPCTSFSSM